MLGSVVCWWNGLNSKLLLTPAFSFPNDCVYAMVNRTKQNERMLIRERYVKDLSDKMHSPSVNGLSEVWLRDHSQRDEMPFSNWGQKSRKKKQDRVRKGGRTSVHVELEIEATGSHWKDFRFYYRQLPRCPLSLPENPGASPQWINYVPGRRR